jgi:hypothetical protein
MFGRGGTCPRAFLPVAAIAETTVATVARSTSRRLGLDTPRLYTFREDHHNLTGPGRWECQVRSLLSSNTGTSANAVASTLAAAAHAQRRRSERFAAHAIHDEERKTAQ